MQIALIRMKQFRIIKYKTYNPVQNVKRLSMEKGATNKKWYEVWNKLFKSFGKIIGKII